jgi:hypothetical protein
MVLWPQTISQDDRAWKQACALLQVLSLDPRMPSPRGYAPRKMYTTARDYLVRPMLWIEKKQVQASYYLYCVRFSVSASIQGSIGLNDFAAINQFCERIDAALNSSLTLEKSDANYNQLLRTLNTTNRTATHDDIITALIAMGEEMAIPA